MRLLRLMVFVLLPGLVLAGRFSPALFAAEDFPAGGRVVHVDLQIEGVGKNEADWRKKAGELIRLRPGDMFTLEGLAADIDALHSSGLFEKIHVPDPQASAAGVSVCFQLTPFRRIKDIQIVGAFPILEREILNAMTIYTGDVFAAESLPAQKEFLVRLYQREGYIDPGINVTATQDPLDGDYVVQVRVYKGSYYIIREMTMQGNRAFSELNLKLRMNAWKMLPRPTEMRRFIQKEIGADAKRILRFYRERQFADCTVTPVIQKDPRTRDARICFQIQEGPRYVVVFDGNREFWDYTLAKELALFKKGNRGDLGLKKSLRHIQERYRKAGYLAAKVAMESSPSIDEDGLPLRQIRFAIEEGPRSLVEAVGIQGNQALDEAKLRKQLLTAEKSLLNAGGFVPEILEEDVRALTALYARNGYRRAMVKPAVEWREEPARNLRLATVCLQIDEGSHTEISGVDIQGLGPTEKAEAAAALGLKKGASFHEDLLRDDENRLGAEVSEQGFPHVQTSAKVAFNEDGSRAALTLAVDKGSKAVMGRVYPSGNFRTSNRIILDEIEQQPGEPFSFKKMLLSQRNIQEIGAFARARIRPVGLKEKAERIDLMVEVEEKKPYFFQAGAGYNSQKKFYANSRVGDHNLFGLNKDAFLGGELSMIGYRLESGLTEPRFAWSRIQAGLNFYGEEKREFNKNFGTRTQGSSLTFERKLTEQINLSHGLRYELRDQFRRTLEPVPDAEKDLYEPRSVFTTGPSITYDSTDSFIRPRKGLTAALTTDVSRGIINSLDDFNKFALRLRYCYSPLAQLTLALRGRVGYIEPHNAQSVIPDDQLFYLGGVADVRGFEENKLRYDASGQAMGGRSEYMGSLEARLDLGLNLELCLFWDTGSIQRALKDEGEDAWRSSMGAGLAYLTPIGPLGLMYGHKLDRRPNETAGRFHFSIGYMF